MISTTKFACTEHTAGLPYMRDGEIEVSSCDAQDEYVNIRLGDHLYNVHAGKLRHAITVAIEAKEYAE